MNEHEVVEWLKTQPASVTAFVQGAAFQLMAIDQGVTEVELYEEFACRAATDPDCNVVRYRPV